MKHYEYYNSDTGEIHSVQLHSDAYVEEANKVLRDSGSPMRFRLAKDPDAPQKIDGQL